MDSPIQRLYDQLDAIEARLNDPYLPDFERHALTEVWEDTMDKLRELETPRPGTPIPPEEELLVAQEEDEEDEWVDNRQDCAQCAGCAYCQEDAHRYGDDEH